MGKRLVSLLDSGLSGGAAVPGNNIYFVGLHGNDSNDGRSWDKAFATFPKAATEVTAQPRTYTNQFAIVCFDAGDYAGNFELPKWSHLIAKSAKINADVILNDDCTFTVREYPTGQITNGTNSGNSGAVIKIDECFDSTTTRTIINIGTNAASIANIHLNIATITNAGIISVNKSTTVVKLKIDNIRYGANGLTALQINNGIVNAEIGTNSKPGGVTGVKRANVASGATLYLYQNSVNVADVPDTSAGTYYPITREVLNIAGLTYPIADGSANDIIKTNGSGVLSFATPSSAAIIKRIVVGTIFQTAAFGVIPANNTIPQISEGDSKFTIPITHVSTSNRVRIKVRTFVGSDTDFNLITASIFIQGGSTHALSAGHVEIRNTSRLHRLEIDYDGAIAAASATTYQVNLGQSNGGAIYFTNRGGSIPYYFFTVLSYVEIEEYIP